MENTNSTQNGVANGVSYPIAIYTTPTCGYCKMVKDFFAEKNVKYSEFDVATDVTKRQEMFDKTHQMGVPVVKIGDQYIVGFDKKKIEESLEKIK